MRIKYLTIKIMEGISIIRAIRSLKGSEYDFFEQMLDYVVGDTTFISSRSKNIICEKLSISVSTYWRRIDKLVELGIIVKDSYGVYELNRKWIKLITIEPSKQEVKKLKACTQKPTYSRF